MILIAYPNPSLGSSLTRPERVTSAVEAIACRPAETL